MTYPSDCKCGGKSLKISSRCKDMCEVELDGKVIYEGYAVGFDFGMDDDSGGDYVIFTYCSKCGQILNGNFPISTPTKE